MKNANGTNVSAEKVSLASRETPAPRRGTWTIMQPVERQIRVAMVLSSVSALFGLAAMCLLALVVKTLIAIPGRWPWQAMLGVAVCTVTAYVLRLVSFNQSHFAAFKLETILRTQLSQRLAQASLGEIGRLGSGALTKVMHDDVKALHVFVADSTPLYARAFVAPIATFLLLLWLDWRLALGAVAVVVIGFAIMSVAMRDHEELSRRYNEARERVSAAVIEFVQAMPVVRTFDTGNTTFSRYQRALESYLEMLTRWYESAGFSARVSMAVLNPMPTLVVLAAMGVWLTARHSLSFAVWIAVLFIGTGMAEAMMPLISLRHLVNKAQLSVARIQQVLTLPILPVPRPDEAKQPREPSVRFEGVTFRYDEGARDALSDVTFLAPKGSITALVGPSGSGKTTIARLIPRFWDVDQGRILIGGVDVREMHPHVLMAQVAFVFQDTFLFADTILNNIRLGMPQATSEDVIAAARAAQAHEFITALPHGYGTQAGERGVFLSGGQRQRITIARAILQNRPILVLDEATAFADPENEAALVEALSHLMRGRTVIMVAHRLSTIRDADQILVFDEGRLAESGRHASLIAHQGLYARLWRNYEEAETWTLRTRGLSVLAGEPDLGSAL